MAIDVAELEARFSAVIRLADERLAVGASADWEEMYRLIRTNFDGYRVALESGGGLLANAGKGYGLGAGRALADCGLEDDEMWTAVSRAEQYYRGGR